MAEQSHIPQEIITAYFPNDITRETVLAGGMLNVTVKVDTADDESVILQQLKDVFKPTTVEDYAIVSEHLATEGWEIPKPVRTTRGDLYTWDDEENIWRATEFLHSDGQAPKIKHIGYAAVYGALLGKLHGSLAKLNYTPRFGLPHFHDTDHYASVLRETYTSLSTEEGQQLSEGLLTTYGELDMLPDSETQLVHGDPRTANMLFRDGEPFTFIDWDTLMRGTKWMDIGDMLRSLSEDALQAGRSIPVHDLLDVAAGYREVAAPETDEHSFQADALRAGQQIAIELAMRFAADDKEGKEGYFDWDPSMYNSRHEHNIVRARAQLEIFRQLEAAKQDL